MNKKTLSIGAVTIIIGLTAMFFVWRSNTPAYTLATVQRGDIVQEVSASGTVEPTVRVGLQFKNSGKIIALPTEVGQKIVAGEVVAKQDTSLLDSQLKQSRANLKAQEYKLESLMENRKENYDEQYDIRAQKAVIEQARADIELQQAKIKETILTSPIDGLVTAIESEVGEIAKPETMVVSLMSSDALRIDVFIPETTIANMQTGQTTRITLDAFDGEMTWSGTVEKIDPAELTRGGAIYYKATLLFDNEDARIKPGMTANVWIKTAVSKNTLLVPASAVQKKDGKKIIQTLRENKVIETEVSTGLKDADGTIEITEGLSEGEHVILRGNN